MSWEMVDEGWGRRAVDFATLGEPASCREYVFMHERLRVGSGDRLLDVACGAGLALELATVRGAVCSGIDASPRLVAVARDRSPDADIRVGDFQALPWSEDSFDIVTSFRGIWGTTPDAVTEANRVLRPGGRIGMTIWGDVAKSPGAWALTPFLWTSEDKVVHQVDMIELGRPGVGEAFLANAGFEAVERFEVPSVIEAPDPASFARSLAASGPAYESIQEIGERAFLNRATELAAQHSREGLPLRAQLHLVGFVGVKR